jgi:hypothetical protein
MPFLLFKHLWQMATDSYGRCWVERQTNESLGNVTECACFVLYDLFWPIILWLSPLMLLLSLSECLSMTDFGCNPLQCLIPPWPWELSCGLALPPDQQWKIPREPKRKQSHFSFVQREQRRSGNVRSWFYLGCDSMGTRCVTTRTTQALVFYTKEADDLLE